MAKTTKNTETPADAPTSTKKGKKQLSQSDVPRFGLGEALRIANAIADNYGKQPASPLDIAIALEIKPTTGHFRYLCGAALAYGITDGGPRSPKIGLTDLGRRIVAPQEESDDLRAKREALLTPRVIGEFLRKYDGSRIPAQNIGRNVLEAMGVPADATERTFDLIVSSANELGLLRELKGDAYVQLDSALTAPPVESVERDTEDEPDEKSETKLELRHREDGPPAEGSKQVTPGPSNDLKTNRRVFITHGKNKKIVEQLKELLVYGDLEPIVSVERESVSKPVPDKVLDDMRSCGAAVIHVGVDQKLLDKKGDEVRVLNPNVLIEIGAAMMRYERNFILLVEEGTTLPSNLQGLYEVRYSGDVLDYNATMKLLKAFSEIKG